MSQALGYFLIVFFFYNALEKSENAASVLQKRNGGIEQLDAFPEAR